MERLTARNSIGQAYYPHCFREDTCDGAGASDKCNKCVFNDKIIEQLARFEELQGMIGIPFERFAELCKEKIPEECKNPSKAIILTDESVDEWNQYKSDKEQGLLLKLPCKVGDTVWVIYANGDLSEQKVEYISKNIHSKEWNIGFHIGQIPFSNFGKTVFLTKEAAEQALADMKGV
ncbi:MAG: hypothetical protein IJP13_08560 [Lachnospiraceae bacterium]|nr:hypothetical protein [Lachnospiraceae bacterium]